MAPGRVRERMMMTTSMTNSAGMPTLLNFSMPPEMPLAVDEIADQPETAAVNITAAEGIGQHGGEQCRAPVDVDLRPGRRPGC